MKRLTTDDEMSIMFSLNTFYAKDGEVWVRGGGPKPDYKDVTLVEWIRSAASKHGLAFTADDPENLGDEMYDALQDGDETVEGILALMHAAAVQAAEMRGRLHPIENILGDDYDLDRLRELVEADRAGRCVVTHCNIGDTIYAVGGKVVKATISEIYFLDDGKGIEYLVDFNCDEACNGCPFNAWEQSFDGEWQCDCEYGNASVFQNDFGNTWFLTEEAAESALKGEQDGKSD